MTRITFSLRWMFAWVAAVAALLMILTHNWRRQNYVMKLLGAKQAHMRFVTSNGKDWTDQRPANITAWQQITGDYSRIVGFWSDKESLSNRELHATLRLPGLRFIDLSETVIDETIINAVTRHQEIEEIYFNNSNLTDEQLSALMRGANIEYIDVSGTMVTDRGLSCFDGYTGSVVIGFDLWTSLGQRNLRKLDNQNLLIQGNGDESIAIAGFPEVSHIGLFGITASMNSATLPKLESVQLTNLTTARTEQALAKLVKVTTLRRLNLTDCGVSENSLSMISKLTLLEELYLGQLRTELTDSDRQLLGAAIPGCKIRAR